MRRLAAHTVVAVLVFSACSQVRQYPEATRDELWVKIELHDGSKHKGALVDLGEDSLLVIAWDESVPDVRAAVNEVRRVELHRGQLTTLEGVIDRTSKEVAIGAGAGTAGGLLLGALFGDPGEGAKAGFGIGVGSGLWSGIHSGVFEGEDSWEEVSMESLRTVYCALKKTPECGHIPPPTA